MNNLGFQMIEVQISKGLLYNLYCTAKHVFSKFTRKTIENKNFIFYVKCMCVCFINTVIIMVPSQLSDMVKIVQKMLISIQVV